MFFSDRHKSKSTISNGSAGEQVSYLYGDILEDQKDHSHPHQSTDMVLTVHFECLLPKMVVMLDTDKCVS